MSEEYVDAKELARRYGVTSDTIHAWHRRGWIPCLRAGHRPVLFDPEDVDRALRARGRQGSDRQEATHAE